MMPEVNNPALSVEEAAWNYLVKDHPWVAKDEYYKAHPEKSMTYRAFIAGSAHGEEGMAEQDALISSLQSERGEDNAGEPDAQWIRKHFGTNDVIYADFMRVFRRGKRRGFATACEMVRQAKQQDKDDEIAALRTTLEAVTKERDELKAKLKATQELLGEWDDDYGKLDRETEALRTENEALKNRVLVLEEGFREIDKELSPIKFGSLKDDGTRKRVVDAHGICEALLPSTPASEASGKRKS